MDLAAAGGNYGIGGTAAQWESYVACERFVEYNNHLCYTHRLCCPCFSSLRAVVVVVVMILLTSPLWTDKPLQLSSVKYSYDYHDYTCNTAIHIRTPSLQSLVHA